MILGSPDFLPEPELVARHPVDGAEIPGRTEDGYEKNQPQPGIPQKNALHFEKGLFHGDTPERETSRAAAREAAKAEARDAAAVGTIP